MAAVASGYIDESHRAAGSSVRRARFVIPVSLMLATAPSAAAQDVGERIVQVDCDRGGTIAAALRDRRPGDTVRVRGTCRESVLIAAELVDVTVDGQGSATVRHPGASETRRHAVFIRGTRITVMGFTITGGDDGIHLSGPAHAVIIGNIITGNAGRGIHIDKSSVAQIANNTIRRNRGVGIHVTEHSYARVGFIIPPQPTLAPNIIEENGGDGIRVARSSGAWIVGNVIRKNGGSGVTLDRGSHADVVGNTIEGNSGDGVSVMRGSGVAFQSEDSSRREGPNRTAASAKNSGVGVRCSVGGYVDGPLGTLAGTQGAMKIDGACVRRAAPR